MSKRPLMLWSQLYHGDHPLSSGRLHRKATTKSGRNFQNWPLASRVVAKNAKRPLLRLSGRAHASGHIIRAPIVVARSPPTPSGRACGRFSIFPTTKSGRKNEYWPLAVAVPLIRHAWTDERVLALDEDLTVSTGAVEGAWHW